MKEEEKRVVSRVLSQHNPSFLLPHICSQCLLSCLLFVLGYGWKCLDFDIYTQLRRKERRKMNIEINSVHSPMLIAYWL